MKATGFHIIKTKRIEKQTNKLSGISVLKNNYKILQSEDGDKNFDSGRSLLLELYKGTSLKLDRLSVFQ